MATWLQHIVKILEVLSTTKNLDIIFFNQIASQMALKDLTHSTFIVEVSMINYLMFSRKKLLILS